MLGDEYANAKRSLLSCVDATSDADGAASSTDNITRSAMLTSEKISDAVGALDWLGVREGSGNARVRSGAHKRECLRRDSG